MKYKLLVTIEKVNDNEYMARAEDVRATAICFPSYRYFYFTFKATKVLKLQ